MASMRPVAKVVTVDDYNGSSHTVDLTDKRSRICSWTDGEIFRLLEILQEERALKDLLAQRNKQVFHYVASKMQSEGADKTWDQCKVKLKNLKSQYRFIKDRMPHVASVDLESDEVIRVLNTEATSKGITSATLKHIKYLKRFFVTLNNFKNRAPHSMLVNRALDRDSLDSQKDESLFDHDGVSPPTSPRSTRNIRIISEDILDDGPLEKNARMDPIDPIKLIEKFQDDIMKTMVDQQRSMQADFNRWEQEREMEHALAMDRFRQKAREQQKRAAGTCLAVLKQCSEALDVLKKNNAMAPVCNGDDAQSNSSH